MSKKLQKRLKRRKDPVIIYGAGIKNYFRMQEAMLYLFAVFAVLGFIQMKIFKSFGGTESIKEFVTPIAENSMGNMGFASNICAKEPIDFVNDSHVTLDFSC